MRSRGSRSRGGRTIQGWITPWKRVGSLSLFVALIVGEHFYWINICEVCVRVTLQSYICFTNPFLKRTVLLIFLFFLLYLSGFSCRLCEDWADAVLWSGYPLRIGPTRPQAQVHRPVLVRVLLRRGRKWCRRRRNDRSTTFRSDTRSRKIWLFIFPLNFILFLKIFKKIFYLLAIEKR